MDNYARGRRRAVWVSTSSDLHHDAERDLQDLGCAPVPSAPSPDLRHVSSPGLCLQSRSEVDCMTA